CRRSLMPRACQSAFLAVCLLGRGCAGPFDPGACTTEYVFALNVQVQDSLTGAWVASGATLIVRDGTYVDSVSGPMNRADADHFPLLAAGERPGTYDVVVQHEGYQLWSRSDVEVGSDKC